MNGRVIVIMIEKEIQVNLLCIKDVLCGKTLVMWHHHTGGQGCGYLLWLCTGQHVSSLNDRLGDGMARAISYRSDVRGSRRDGCRWLGCQIGAWSSATATLTQISLKFHMNDITRYSQRRVNMAVADALVPVWHQGICNNHNNVGRSNLQRNELRSLHETSNGNIFRVTDPLCWEFSGHRWIPRTKASDAELWYFLWCAPE